MVNASRAGTARGDAHKPQYRYMLVLAKLEFNCPSQNVPTWAFFCPISVCFPFPKSDALELCILSVLVGNRGRCEGL